ncbi:MAG: biopolymer transporter ExbD [Phycisphaerae bacterium]|nr:biopolymer transporter ExbD [Phycisphaerae bacterium]
MAKRKLRKGGGGADELNMTPMIDCTFQLIIFFVLTAKMAQEDAEVLVPDPQKSAAVLDEKGNKIFKNRVTVNIPNKYGKDDTDRDPVIASRATRYVVKGNEDVEVGDIDTLVLILKKYRTQAINAGVKSEEFFMEIRCDKDIAFDSVLPVMFAAEQAEISKMAITAIADPEKQYK